MSARRARSGPGRRRRLHRRALRDGAASASCAFIAGNPGTLGFGPAGSAGNCFVASTTTCLQQTNPNALLFTAPVAQFGGGAGIFTGYRAYGSGGGGPAGGAPGRALRRVPCGEQDCSGVSGGGGAVNGQGGKAGASRPTTARPAPAGRRSARASRPASRRPAWAAAAAAASAARPRRTSPSLMTFQTGSGGGGGSADYLNRPVFGGTSGGGGGGGALKLSSPVSITVSATASSSPTAASGGDARIGTAADANCDPQPGAAGGGGSGGVIYLAAPSLTVAAGGNVSAAGGGGGAGSEFATGGGGGNGGLGRIRLSVNPGCTLGGQLHPAARVRLHARQQGRLHVRRRVPELIAARSPPSPASLPLAIPCGPPHAPLGAVGVRMPVQPAQRARSVAASILLAAAPLPDLSLVLLPSPPDAGTLAQATPAPASSSVPEGAARIARALHLDPSAVAGLALGAGALWALGPASPPASPRATCAPNAVGFALAGTGALGVSRARGSRLRLLASRTCASSSWSARAAAASSSPRGSDLQRLPCFPGKRPDRPAAVFRSPASSAIVPPVQPSPRRLRALITPPLLALALASPAYAQPKAAARRPRPRPPRRRPRRRPRR